jgi:aldehyde dehydrogenase (NAD+)
MGESLHEFDWNRLYIDGEWREQGDRDTLSVENPSTREEFTKVPAGTEADVDEAFEAAEAARDAWAERPPHERAAAIEEAIATLESYQDDLVSLVKSETGSAPEKADREFIFSHGVMDEASSHPLRVEGDFKEAMTPGKDCIIRREPVGTVGVISPWNFPTVLTVRAVAPALALGNAVVLKPAGQSSVTGGLFVAKIFEETSLPDGLLNVVTGRGSVVGDALASHPDAAVVSFTGSTPVGRSVGKAAVENLNFPALELGGNNPYIVTENADMDNAVAGGVYGAFHHQGQSCISINRHIVHEAVYDEYVERVTERARELNVGDPFDEDTHMGPVIDESARDAIVQYIEDTVARGATLETGGDYEELFVEPTVLSAVTNDMPAACNENFGPIAPIIRYSTDEEAVEIANDTEYGLSAAVQSQDIDQAWGIADRIESGMVHINDNTAQDDPQVPFGGMKNSGIGRYNGQYIIEELTEPKWVSIQTTDHEYPF